MRLVVCIFLSLVIHIFFLDYAVDVQPVPDLSVSKLQAGTVIRLRTRTSRPVTSVSKVPTANQKPKPKKTATPTEQKRKHKIEKNPSPVAKQKEPVKQIEKQRTSSQQSRREEYQNRASRQPQLVDRQDYISNPPPPYPDAARRRRQEGTVVLLVDLTAQGHVQAVSIKESSGVSILDTTAKKAVSNWRFSPRENGVGIRRVLVPISFRLRR